jgi:hypothetical protein
MFARKTIYFLAMCVSLTLLSTQGAFAQAKSIARTQSNVASGNISRVSYNTSRGVVIPSAERGHFGRVHSYTMVDEEEAGAHCAFVGMGCECTNIVNHVSICGGFGPTCWNTHPLLICTTTLPPWGN